MVHTKSLKSIKNNKLHLKIIAWENRHKELGNELGNELGLKKLERNHSNNKEEEKKASDVRSLSKNPVKLYKASNNGSIKFKNNEKHLEPSELIKQKETHKSRCKEFFYNELYRRPISETSDDVFEWNENGSGKNQNNKINNDSDKYLKTGVKENGSVKYKNIGVKEYDSVKYINTGIKVKSLNVAENDKSLLKTDTSKLSTMSHADDSYLETKCFIYDNISSDFLMENMRAATISCIERRTRSHTVDNHSDTSSSTKIIKKPFYFKNQFRSSSYSESDRRRISSNNKNKWTICQDESIYLPCESDYLQKFSSEETSTRLSVPLKKQQTFYQECSEVATSSLRSLSITESDSQHYRPQLGNLTVIRRCSAPALLSADKFLTTKSQTPSVESVKSNNRRKNYYVDEQNNKIFYELQKSNIDEENHFKVIQDNIQLPLFNKCELDNNSLKKNVNSVFNKNFLNDKDKLMEDIPKSKRKLSQQKDYFDKQVSNIETTPHHRTRKFSLPEISYNSSLKKDDDDDDDETHVNFSSKAKKKTI
ncbi:uncharacterized protein LOC136076711 [Hydra vulgaris]|uniref:Uncharacterized protein LOC136076711 n=1 Tax=Hydra vulgaris TaxID=6087 RepID=A0ABM4BB56_HYDVU